MNDTEIITLVKDLSELPDETEWVELKFGNDNPVEIGEYISALSNSAALHSKPSGYILWGVADGTHEITGTTFNPRKKKIGNEELENWLTHLLDPNIDFKIYMLDYDGKPVVLFIIPCATHQPVKFKGIEYIRVGSYKKKLADYPEKERTLWQTFDKIPFELHTAKENCSTRDILNLMDYPSYYELTGQSIPDNHKNIIDAFCQERFIRHKHGETYDILNFGAILFAKRLDVFERLSRKAIRVIVYKGFNRVETIREQVDVKGYAVGFEGAISFVNALLPENEFIGMALRKTVKMYPDIAIRELVANAIIHQDFAISGSGPMIEIFSDRIEITNPGVPLIDISRFIGTPPQSRNETLASFMRRIHICEERGSGIPKVITVVEAYQLPAPDIAKTEIHTRVTLFAPRSFSQMGRDDRIRACYQHACLRYMSSDFLTNTSLRDRFGIAKENYPMVSRIISDAIAANLIKRHNPDSAGKRNAKYIPYWA